MMICFLFKNEKEIFLLSDSKCPKVPKKISAISQGFLRHYKQRVHKKCQKSSRDSTGLSNFKKSKKRL
jgi:hypothetical protein